MTEISPQHPDLEVLADIEAGDGADVELTDREHVDDCAECQENLTAITALRADLAALPEPEMPASVAARIDAALAEAEARTVLPLARKPSKERRFIGHSGLASGVAAGVIALLATVLVVGHYAGGDDNDSTTALSSPERSAQDGSFEVTNSGRAYSKNRDALVAALPSLLAHDETALRTGAFAPGAGAPAAAPVAPGAETGGADGTSEPGDTASQDSAQPGSVAGGVGSSLSKKADRAARAAIIALQQDAEAVRQCAIALTDQAAPPLAVDVGSYGGEPVAAFVFVSPDNADELDLYLVRPACGPTDIRLYLPHLPRP